MPCRSKINEFGLNGTEIGAPGAKSAVAEVREIGTTLVVHAWFVLFEGGLHPVEVT